MGNRPDALLIVDGRHLRQTLDRLVVANVEQQAQVAREIVSALEDLHRITFTRRALHDATLTGKPNDLHRLLRDASSESQRKTNFVTCIRPMTPRTGPRIDPETLEPMDDKEVTIMVDDGVGMSLCLDVLGAMAKPYKALVVITADGDLSQVLEQASNAGTQVSVCGMRDTMSPSLLKFVTEPTCSMGGAKWLESLVLPALERLVARGDGMKGVLRRKCSLGRQCQMQEESHLTAYLHPCPDWSMCDQVPKPLEVSPTSGRYWLPEDRLDLEHIQRYQHPCPLANCRIKGMEHRFTWDHSEQRQQHGFAATCEEEVECNRLRRAPHELVRISKHDAVLKPGSPHESFWPNFHSFDHSSSYTENNVAEKRSRATLPFRDCSGDLDDGKDADEEDEEMREFLKVLNFTFTRNISVTSKNEEDEETAYDEPTMGEPLGNDHLALFPMSM